MRTMLSVKNISDKKSLIEQILEGMFARIEGRKEFDAQTIEKLKYLASKDKLNDSKRIVEAITPESGENHEDT